MLWPWGTRPQAVDQPTAVNPLELGAALKFGALLGGVLIATKFAQLYPGTAGVYGLAVVSGLADIDAAILSLAKAAPIDLAATVAATAITLLVLSNTFSKMTLAITLGGRRSGPIPMYSLSS